MKTEHIPAIKGERDDEGWRRMEEAVEVLRAISTGSVDAFVVSPDDDPRVITLSSADQSYRLITDKIAQGAVTVAADSTILYANKPFATLLGVSVEGLVGHRLVKFMVDSDIAMLEALLTRARLKPVHAELLFKRQSETFPAHIQVDMPFEDASARCIVVTDLSERRKNEAIVAAEALGRSILEQALDAVVVCDLEGKVIRASKSSHVLCGCNPLLKPFAMVFPLCGGSAPLSLDHVQRGHLMRNQAFEMVLPDRRVSLLVNAGPVTDATGEAVACVITLTDITQLARAEAELKEADARKDEMLAVVVHELRNPLSSISLVRQLLDRGATGPQEILRARDTLKREVERIARLIDDLTDFNRIRFHKLSIQLEELDLRTVLERAVESERPRITARRQHLNTSVPEKPVMVSADEGRLAQVLTNLLNNAMKFTPEYGRIDVSLGVDLTGCRACLTVQDNGAGVSATMLPRIFNAFEQGLGSERRGGLGLGLTLARRIIELHGGDLEATSEGEGTGSTFTVRLPLIH